MLSNAGEERFATDPHDADTDDDGVSDWDEDSDGDGYRDGRRQDAPPDPGEPGAGPCRCEGRPCRALQAWLPRQASRLHGQVLHVHVRPGGRSQDRGAHRRLPRCALVPGPQRGGATSGMAARSPMTKSSCPVADVTPIAQGRPPDGGLRSLAQGPARQYHQVKPDLVIASTFDGYEFVGAPNTLTAKSERLWRQGLTRSLAAFRADAPRVVMLGDVFHWGKPEFACMKEHPNDLLEVHKEKGLDVGGLRAGTGQDREAGRGRRPRVLPADAADRVHLRPVSVRGGPIPGHDGRRSPERDLLRQDLASHGPAHPGHLTRPTYSRSGGSAWPIRAFDRLACFAQSGEVPFRIPGQVMSLLRRSSLLVLTAALALSVVGVPVTSASGSTRELSTATAAVADVTAAEQLVVELINERRHRKGLRSLRVDSRLGSIARARSEDMVDRDYFSHEDPDGKYARNFLERARIKYSRMSEIIAWNRGTDLLAGAEHAVAMWMDFERPSARDPEHDPQLSGRRRRHRRQDHQVDRHLHHGTRPDRPGGQDHLGGAHRQLGFGPLERLRPAPGGGNRRTARLRPGAPSPRRDMGNRP